MKLPRRTPRESHSCQLIIPTSSLDVLRDIAILHADAIQRQCCKLLLVKHTPHIPANTAQLWRMDTPVTEHALAVLRSALNAREMERAQSLVNPKHRTRFITRRGLLRTILATLLSLDPAGIEFTYGPQGKPMLCPRAHPQNALHFNLSHCNDLAILGVTRDQEIGVDLEAINTRRNIEGIAERFFHPQEWAHIAAMPPADRPAAFFDNWACKEAIVKASGGGIVSGLSDFIIHNVSHIPGERACEHLNPAARPGRWTLRTMQLTDHDQKIYRAAIALPGEAWQLSPSVFDALHYDSLSSHH